MKIYGSSGTSLNVKEAAEEIIIQSGDALIHGPYAVFSKKDLPEIAEKLMSLSGLDYILVSKEQEKASVSGDGVITVGEDQFSMSLASEKTMEIIEDDIRDHIEYFFNIRSALSAVKEVEELKKVNNTRLEVLAELLNTDVRKVSWTRTSDVAKAAIDKLIQEREENK